MFVKLVTMKIKSLTYFCLCVKKATATAAVEKHRHRESTRERGRDATEKWKHLKCFSLIFN